MSSRLDDFRPPRDPDPVLVRRSDVGAAAWHGLHRDGALRPLWGDLARVADVAETAELRAGALAVAMPPRSVLARAAAVWVHTGRGRPARVDAYVRPGSRRGRPHPLRVVHECALAPDETVLVGGVPVTTAARTAVDVARWAAAAQAAPLLDALLAVGLDRDETLRVLASQRGRHLVAARSRLSALFGADDAAPGAGQARIGGSWAALEPVIR